MKMFVGRWTFADSFDEPFDAGSTRDPSCPLYLAPHVRVDGSWGTITKEPFKIWSPFYPAFIRS